MKKDSIYIGLVLIAVILMGLFWRKTASMIGSGGGDTVAPYVPRGLQMPTIYAPNITIDFSGIGGGYKPNLTDPNYTAPPKVEKLPTCGCAGHGGIGEGSLNLPELNQPIRHDPIKSGSSIPLLGAPRTRDVEFVVSKAGDNFFYAAYEATDWKYVMNSYGRMQASYGRGDFIGAWSIPKANIPYGGSVYNMSQNARIDATGTAVGTIPIDIRSLLARTGLSNTRYVMVPMAPVWNYIAAG